MTQHNHHSDHHRKPAGKRLHRDWRLWVVVAVMLAATLAYVFSDNESLRFSGGPPKPKPSSAAPR